MVVIALHPDDAHVSSHLPLIGAAAVLTVYRDGDVEIEGDASLFDFTLSVRCTLTRRRVEVWDDAERWARGLARHPAFRERGLRVTLVVDARVPDAVEAVG